MDTREAWAPTAITTKPTIDEQRALAYLRGACFAVGAAVLAGAVVYCLLRATIDLALALAR